MNILEKTRKVAEKYERFALLIHILDWERRLKSLLDEGQRSEEQISGDEKKALDKKVNIFEMEVLCSKAQELKRKYGYLRGNQKALLNKEVLDNLLMKDEKKCLSQRARYYFYYTHTLCHWILQEHVNGYYYSKKMLAVNEQILHKLEFLNCLLEHTTACFCMGYFDEVLKYIEVAEKFTGTHPDIQHMQTRIRLFYYRANYSIISYNYMGDASNLQKVLNWAENEMADNNEYFSSEMKLVLYSGMCDGFFCLGQLDKAWKYMNEIINTSKKSVRTDVYDGTVMFNLFYWLEEGEYELLKSAVNSAHRHFRINNIDQKYDIEIEIINAFMQCENFNSAKSRLTLYKNIKVVIQDFYDRAQALNNFQEYYQLYFLYADAKIQNIPFHEAAKMWYQKHMKQKTVSRQPVD